MQVVVVVRPLPRIAREVVEPGGIGGESADLGKLRGAVVVARNVHRDPPARRLVGEVAATGGHLGIVPPREPGLPAAPGLAGQPLPFRLGGEPVAVRRSVAAGVAAVREAVDRGEALLPAEPVAVAGGVFPGDPGRGTPIGGRRLAGVGEAPELLDGDLVDAGVERPGEPDLPDELVGPPPRLPAGRPEGDGSGVLEQPQHKAGAVGVLRRGRFEPGLGLGAEGDRDSPGGAGVGGDGACCGPVAVARQTDRLRDGQEGQALRGAAHVPPADLDVGLRLGAYLDDAEDRGEGQGDGAVLARVQREFGLPRRMARLRIADPMGHARGETEVLRRRRRLPVDGERTALRREGERHPAVRAGQPVVAFRLGGVVGDVDRIRAGLVAVVGDPQRMDAAPGSEDQRGLPGGLAVVRHPRPVRLRGDRDPPFDRRQRQRQGVGAPSLGIQRLRRGNVPGMPGIDGVSAGRDLDFEAWAFGHERAVEEPPDRGMAGLGGRPEGGGALAQDDVDVAAGPGRLRDRDGFGHEALSADA